MWKTAFNELKHKNEVLLPSIVTPIYIQGITKAGFSEQCSLVYIFSRVDIREQPLSTRTVHISLQGSVKKLCP